MSASEIHVVTDYKDFLLLEPEWSKLLASSRSNSVFLTHQWLRCWWEAFGGTKGMLILCARHNGRLLGAAPLFLEKTRFRGLPVRKLSFMANDYTGHADFVLSSSENGSLRLILQYLNSQRGIWDLLEFSRLTHDSPLLVNIACAAARNRWFYSIRSDIQIPYIVIEGSWASFISQRSTKFRKGIRGRLNRIGKYHLPFRVAKLCSADSIGKSLISIIRISSNSWKATHRQSLVDNPDVVSFFERLSAVLGERGWVELWILYCGDVPVAFEYHLNYHGVTSPIRADFDETYRHLSPGAHLEYMILLSSFEASDRPVREYDTCADAYPYELRWTSKIRPHKKLRVFKKSCYGSILHLMALVRRLETRKERKTVKSCRPRA